MLLSLDLVVVPVKNHGSGVTTAIANLGIGNTDIIGQKSYALMKVGLSTAGWIRLYTDSTSRSNDVSRSVGEDPAPGSGVIAEVVTTGISTQQIITPFAMGGNMDEPVTIKSTSPYKTYLVRRKQLLQTSPFFNWRHKDKWHYRDFKINGGWQSPILSLRWRAFTHLGWNAGTITGYIVGLSSFWGGGDTNASDTYHDVYQKSTSGIGTGASFWVYRDTAGVRSIRVNRPGVGYTSGELVTISADDIGGLGNGAADVSFKVCVDEVVANGGSYGIAVTNGNNNSFNFLGADRNGTVGGGVSVVTIREGDTLSIGNSWSTSYYPQIKNPTPVVPNGLLLQARVCYWTRTQSACY